LSAGASNAAPCARHTDLISRSLAAFSGSEDHEELEEEEGEEEEDDDDEEGKKQ